jgi:hypothetical protein
MACVNPLTVLPRQAHGAFAATRQLFESGLDDLPQDLVNG